jgi:hypothetical protein
MRRTATPKEHPARLFSARGIRLLLSESIRPATEGSPKQIATKMLLAAKNFISGELFAVVFYRQQVSAYQEANATLRAQVAALEQDSERRFGLSSVSSRRSLLSSAR